MIRFLLIIKRLKPKFYSFFYKFKFFIINYYKIKSRQTRQLQADWEITREFFRYTGLVYFAISYYARIIAERFQKEVFWKNFFLFKKFIFWVTQFFFWFVTWQHKLYTKLFEAAILNFHVILCEGYLFLRTYIYDQFDRFQFWDSCVFWLSSRGFLTKKFKQKNPEIDDDEN